LKFAEKNAVNEAAFAKELRVIPAEKAAVSWRTGTCAKSAGCEWHSL
jgi:hypothetical protein